MKKKEKEKILRKFIMPYLDDFILKGNFVYHKDTNELLRGFLLESSGYNPESVCLNVFVQPLYLQNENLILNFGHRIRNKAKLEWLDFDKVSVNDSGKELLNIVKNDGLLFLDKIKNAHDFYTFYQGDVRGLRTIEAWTFTSVYINHKDALSNLNNFIMEISKRDLNIEWIRQLLFDAEEMKKLYISKQSEIIQLFKKWYAQTVTNLKL